jgi:hypothetical protein
LPWSMATVNSSSRGSILPDDARVEGIEQSFRQA